MLTVTLAADERSVLGVDPSRAMLDYASCRPGGHRVRWLLGDSRAVAGAVFDAAIMSGNVAQHIPADEWSRTLSDLRSSLRDGGILAFESRNPAARAWLGWSSAQPRLRESTHGPVQELMEVREVRQGVVDLLSHNRFIVNDEEVVHRQTLVFRTAPQIVQDLHDAGFGHVEVYGDWVRGPLRPTSPLMVFLATATSDPGESVHSTDDARVLRDDDPAAAVLLRRGSRLVAESWGARLVLPVGFEQTPYRAAVQRATRDGVEIGELDSAWTEALLTFEDATRDDFPMTPATPQPVPRDADDLARAWAAGARCFAAVRDSSVLGATWIRVQGDGAETDTTAVLASERHRGLAVGVKAAAILAAAEAGARHFATGGAAANAASIAMDQALGYTLTERWLSLVPPASDPGESPSSRPIR